MRFEHKGCSFWLVQDPDTPGAVKVYVPSQPSYNGRDESAHTTHRYSGRNGSPNFICFKDEHKPKTVERAVELAKDWAERTQEYVRTGRTISQQIERERNR